MDQEEQQSSPARPMVWTPQESAGFLAAAIKEAQAPFTDALKRQGVSKGIFVLVLLSLLLLVGGAGTGLFFYLREERISRLEAQSKAEALHQERLSKMLDRMREAEQAAVLIQKEKALLEGRLDLAKRMESENQALQTKLDSLQKELAASAEESIRCQQEARAARSQSEAAVKQKAKVENRLRLVQSQIDGLNEEKAALAKQLNATRRLNEMLQEGSTTAPAAEPEEAEEVEEAAEPAGPVDEKKEVMERLDL